MSDGLEKHGTTIAVGLVAAAAAVVSVDHLADLSWLAGTRGWRVCLLPIVVDGQVAVSTLTLRRAHRLGVPAGWVPWASLIFGLLASVSGNVVAVHPDLVDRDHLKIAVGAYPPLALALSLHQVLYRPDGHGDHHDRAPRPDPKPPEPQPRKPPNPAAPKPAALPTAKLNGNGHLTPRVAELLPAAREIAVEHKGNLTRRALADGLAERDESAGTSTLVKLLAVIDREQAG